MQGPHKLQVKCISGAPSVSDPSSLYSRYTVLHRIAICLLAVAVLQKSEEPRTAVIREKSEAGTHSEGKEGMATEAQASARFNKRNGMPLEA